KHHEDKARVAKEALAQGRGTQFLRPKGGRWQINQNPIADEKARRKAGVLEAKSSSLVQDIEDEAKALNAALAELQAAYATKFNETTTKGKGNVTDTPRTQGTRSTSSSTGSAAVQASAQGGSAKAGAAGRAMGST